ncbi:Protein kinase domain-containing protein [Mycena venus]|uniref:Protein kinase domain-containing protein n=1 Tax=Mycena venus TaxID=2733690 RepID=A0A8H7CCT0_9AGAR|nr:Protein kinase domain-containing protein [Mycena venus]
MSGFPQQPYQRATLNNPNLAGAIPQADPGRYYLRALPALDRQQPPNHAPEWNIHHSPWFKIHQNFVIYVLYTVGLKDGPTNEITESMKQWEEWDVLTSLANYHFVVEVLFRYLKESPNLHRVSARDVSDRLTQDISCVVDEMDSVLSDRAAYKNFLSCRGTLAQRLLDLLQDLLDSDESLRYRPLLSKALIRLSRECELHPTCLTLSGVERMGQQVAGGGFGDIWKGSVGGQTVAVKSMRVFRDDDVKASLKKVGREALIWRQLSHPNLLPFFGLYVLDDRPSLISPWMDNGDLNHFLNKTPGVDRVSLIADVAMGLEYLHSEHIVHGDLKAANILVTPSSRACIADFGLSSIIDEFSLNLTFSSHTGRAGTVRYQAPELLLSSERPNDFGSDVYGFACVGYEILTRKAPFFEVSNDAAIILQVIRGGRPSRLEGIAQEDLWLLLDDCWHQQAEKRPTMAAIIKRPLIEAKIKQSPPDRDDTVTYSARFRRSVQQWPLLPSIADIERKIPCSERNVDDTSYKMILSWLGTLNPSPAPFDSNAHANQAGTTTVPFLWNNHSPYWTPKTSPGGMPSSTGAVVFGLLDPSKPVIHRWLDAHANAPAIDFHFDLGSALFAPLRAIPSPPRILNSAELGQSAFDPGLTTLRIVHPRIPFWPIELELPAEMAAANLVSSITLGDVLVHLHRGMHQLVTRVQWESLDMEVQGDVTEAFVARCRAEAMRSQVPPEQLQDREVAIRNEGLKRVDYLLGKTVFKGLAASEDSPRCMLLVTA